MISFAILAVTLFRFVLGKSIWSHCRLSLNVSRISKTKPTPMEVFLRLKDLHAYGKICESVHKTASANKICKRKRSFAKV